jgi:hypothetical protein
VQARAENKAREGSTNESSANRDAEAAKIAELERRSRRGSKKATIEQKIPPAPTTSSSSGGDGFAEWNEGELLPKGFDKMNPVRPSLASVSPFPQSTNFTSHSQEFEMSTGLQSPSPTANRNLKSRSNSHKV